MVKRIYNKNNRVYFGTIGQDTGILDLKVGDIVVSDEYGKLNDRGLSTTFVAYDNSAGHFTLMGSFGTSIREKLDRGVKIQKVVDSEYVTEELLNHVRFTSVFTVEEVETVKMTLQEIEEKLGFPVEVII